MQISKFISAVWYAFIGANLISFLTTAVGLYQILAPSIPVAEALPEEVVVYGTIALCVLLSFVLQRMIAGCWPAIWTRELPVIVRAATIPLAIGLSMISGAWAASAWLRVLNGDDIQQVLDIRVFEGVAGHLITFSEQAEQVMYIATEVETHSLAMAKLEVSKGTSCENAGAVVRACGPRCEMRKALATESSRFMADAAALSDKALDIATLPSKTNQSVIDEAYAEARNLMRNGTLRELGRWADETQARFRNGFVHPDGQGKTFMCRDAKMEALLAGLSETASRKVDLPVVAPRVEILDKARSAELTFGQVFNPMFAKLGFDVTLDPEIAEQAQPALTVAFIIEGAIVVMAMILALSKAASTAPRSGPTRRPPAGQEDTWQIWTTLMDEHVIEEGRRAYLWVPEGNSTEERERRLQLIELIRRFGMRRVGPGDAIDPQEIWAQKGSGMGAAISIYRVPASVIRWWRSVQTGNLAA